MRTTTEPVVVMICPELPEPRSAFLADVLIIVANQHLSCERRADLFLHYSGLTLVLMINRDDEVMAQFRDGMVLTLQNTGTHAAAADYINAAAEFLYFSWVTGLLRSTGADPKIR